MVAKAREEEVKKARRFLDLIKDFEDKGSWVKDFLSSIGNDINEALPPMKIKRGFDKLEKGDKAGFEEMTSALGEGATAFLPVGGVLSKADKLKKLVGTRKLGNAQAWIEKAGGKVLNIAEDGLATWKDAAGKVRKSLLTDRFGPRDVGLSKRQLRENPRAEDADDIAAGFTDNLLTKRADKDDIVSRVSEKSGVSREEIRERAIEGKKWEKNVDDVEDLEDDLPPMRGSKSVSRPKMSSRILDDDDELPSFSGRHAADSTGISTEETHRIGNFYKIGKTGEPTYLSKAVDAGNLSPDEAIIQVVKGKEPTIYQGSGPASALNRFKKTRTGAEFYKFRSEGGLGGAKPNLGKRREIISATEIPQVHTSRYANMLKDRVGKRRIVFPSDFDKVAYNLAITKIPDKRILADLMKQTKFTADTILQHGEKVKNRVTQLGSTGRGNINLPIRSVSVIDVPKDPSLKRQVLGLPSEYLFSGDLPHLRQLLRPVLTHPFKTGIPSLRRAFSSMTEKGYREQLEKLPDELKLFDVLDTATAIGPTKAAEKFPFIKDLSKIAGSGHDIYDYFGTGNLGEKFPIIGNLPKVSRRMFDISMKSARGTETQRLADTLGMSIEDLAKKGHSELPSMRRSVLEHTGHGPLGPFEGASDLFSTLFTSPRNTTASMQTWNPLNYLPESALHETVTKYGLGGRYGTTFKSPIYRDNLKDTAKMVAGYGGLEAADKLLGDDEKFTMNPLDTSVGANINNYRPDTFGSAKGVATLIPKMLQPLMRAGASKLDETFDTELEDTFTGVNAKGEDMDFSPSEEFNKFARYRLRPGIISMLGDLTLGYNRDTGEPGSDQGTFNNAIGEDITKPYDEDSPIMSVPGLDKLAELPGSRWVGDQFTTSWPSNVYDAFKDAGIAEGGLATVLGGLGSGSATYDPFSQDSQMYRPGYKNIKIEVRPKKRQQLGVTSSQSSESKKKQVLPGGIR